MKLSELLHEITPVTLSTDPLVTGITHDSRNVVAGNVFCAVSGTSVHGGNYIDSVIDQKPSAILLDCDYNLSDETAQRLQTNAVGVLRVPNLKASIGRIASRFFQSPSQRLSIIAVTGTNGKTSVCHFLAEALHYLQIKCAVLGTAGSGFIGELSAAALTTPDATQVHSLLADFVAQGATMTALEASSHALTQHRLSGCQIETAVFTNLTPEHLDYHVDMTAYGAAKETLLQWPGLRQAVINADDPLGLRWCHRYHNCYPIIAYSTADCLPKLPKNVTLIHGKLQQMSNQGIRAEIVSPWGCRQIELPILGKFNLANCLAVLGVMQFYQIPFVPSIACLQKIHGVCGRMQLFTQVNKPTIVVDFAHTPDALASALSSLRAHVKGKLWCVFGCGGNRDKLKRPLMGKIAAQLADFLILTNDNPRQEDPEQIIADIKQGIPPTFTGVHLEMDRAASILYAIAHAKSADIILVAGKGHETYQLIGDTRYPFSDQAVVRAGLQNDLESNRYE